MGGREGRRDGGREGGEEKTMVLRQVGDRTQ